MPFVFYLPSFFPRVSSGFYSCLSEKGDVYDTTKYGWMNARQVSVMYHCWLEAIALG